MQEKMTITAVGKSVTTGATTANTTLPLSSSGEVPRFVRIAATGAASFRLGAAGVVATAGDTLIQPGDADIFAVPSGYTSIAYIQQTAASVLQISPLENC